MLRPSFSLVIPSGTPDEVTSFTLDPVECVEVLPFSRLLGAVDIFLPTPFHTPLTVIITLSDGTASEADTMVTFVGSSLVTDGTAGGKPFGMSAHLEHSCQLMHRSK
jgi:hypothetical protein